jgi:hypothetical protein|tara:strand:+ start:4132 stop:4320 length:189 start_codon:yes stop_codon:yes gene_type:complete
MGLTCLDTLLINRVVDALQVSIPRMRPLGGAGAKHLESRFQCAYGASSLGTPKVWASEAKGR